MKHVLILMIILMSSCSDNPIETISSIQLKRNSIGLWHGVPYTIGTVSEDGSFLIEVKNPDVA